MSSHLHLLRGRRPGADQRGFTFIGLLIVLVIIGILVSRQWGTPEEPGINRIALQRSSDAACTANRAMTARAAQMWAFDNPGRVPSIDDLREGNRVAGSCDKGGIWTILPDGSIHCTYHDEALDEYILEHYGNTDQAQQILASERIQEVLRLKYPDSPYIARPQ